MVQTLDRIRRDGLAALRSKLGRAGMIRFLQQFETGSGNYAQERHTWVDRVSMIDLRKSANRLRTSRSRKA